MSRKKHLFIGTLLALLALPSVSGRVFAVDSGSSAPQTSTKAWTNSGEVSVLSTNGNSKGTTTAVKDTFNYHWTRSMLELIGAGLGSSNNHQVTSEQYDAAEKVTWTLEGKNYSFERLAWNKNRFAGIQNQYNATLGLGRYFIDKSSDTLLTELGPGYINTQYTQAARTDYASARAFAHYTHKLSATASFNQTAEYLHDFNNSKNYYINTETAIIASLTTHLSLKASYAWHRAGDPPPGFGKDDTITSMALIINY